MDKTLTEIINYIAKFVDYVDNFTVDCREKENAIQRLEESVFWLTYLNEEE